MTFRWVVVFWVGGIPANLVNFNSIVWIIDGFKSDSGSKSGPKDG
jgi:hypothetical protein